MACCMKRKLFMPWSRRVPSWVAPSGLTLTLASQRSEPFLEELPSLIAQGT